MHVHCPIYILYIIYNILILFQVLLSSLKMPTSELTKKLSYMDLVVCSEVEDSHYIAWSIKDFPRHLRNCDSVFKTESLPVQLSDLGEGKCILFCSPYKLEVGWPDKLTDGKKDSIELNINLTLRVNNSNTFITMGLLDRDGNEQEICRRRILMGKLRENISRAWLKDSADRMFPDGTLHVYVKLMHNYEPSVKSTITKGTQPQEQQQLGQPTENLFSSMADSSFVDIGPSSSVLLVFEDGEQRCHTFPLAARHGLVHSS